MRRARPGAAYARENALIQLEKQKKKEAERAARWQLVEGPLPLDVWKRSLVVDSWGNYSGCSTTHVRSLGEGFYMQTAGVIGWTFNVAIKVET